MAAFWFCSALLVLAALGFILPPLLRREAGVAVDPRREALQRAHADGVLDSDEYAAKLAALGPAPAQASASGSPLRGPAIAVALLLPLAAIGLYLKLGDTRVFDPDVQSVTQAMQQAQQAGLPPMEQAIAGLAERLAREPDDVQGWLLLGRAYKSMERFGEARDAFARALTLAPDTPDLLVEYAESQVLASDSKRFDGEPLAMLERALEQQPTHQRGLWLLGVAQYQRGDTDAASATWQTLLDTMPEDNPAYESLRQRILELQAQASGETLPTPAAAQASAAGDSTNTASDPAQAPRLNVRVRVAPELAAQVRHDDVLFVFARAAEGSRAPLAIQRLSADALPLELVLDDSHAMLPQMNLSSTAQIVVGARISRSGGAQAQSGDLETLSEPLPNTQRATVDLIIDRVVP
ncbi:MAG: c-type cytochrome biogenesis protein CcmI [Lysobacteraceae bacterium]